MYTTLNGILRHGPCGIYSDGENGFSKLLKNLNKTEPDDEPLHVMDILKSNGIHDAIWSLRCFDYLDYCLFLADVAELVLPILENKYPNDDRPRKAIRSIRDYKSDLISREELIAATSAACDAARDAAYIAVGFAVGFAVGYAAYTVVACAAKAAAVYVAAAIGSWTKIEELFIKHFGGQNEHSNSAQ